MKVFSVLTAAVALVLVGASLFEAFAEDGSTIRRKALETFSGARDQRSKLLSEIPRLKDAVEDLQRRKMNLAQLQGDKQRAEEDLVRVEQDLKRARSDLAAAPANDKARIQDRIRAMEEFETRTKSRQSSTERTLLQAGQDAKRIDEDLGKKQTELVQAQAGLETAEQSINEFLNFEAPRQRFKLYMSAVFAALVAGVIGGFFWIATKDERVRRAIFSGTAGIQFVTLFSLVIAIILFGIIEILEGKELAALLGGLSGYILGRATSERGGSARSQTDPGQAGTSSSVSQRPAGTSGEGGPPPRSTAEAGMP